MLRFNLFIPEMMLTSQILNVLQASMAATWRTADHAWKAAYSLHTPQYPPPNSWLKLRFCLVTEFWLRERKVTQCESGYRISTGTGTGMHGGGLVDPQEGTKSTQPERKCVPSHLFDVLTAPTLLLVAGIKDPTSSLALHGSTLCGFHIRDQLLLLWGNASEKEPSFGAIAAWHGSF
jgi:hypothetical protein